MNESLKKLLVIVSVSVIIFWIFKPKGNDEDSENMPSSGKKTIRKPILDEQDMENEQLRSAYEALCAYIDANNAGESTTVLNKMKEDFKTEMNVDIYQDASGKLAVRDMDGNDILVNGS